MEADVIRARLHRTRSYAHLIEHAGAPSGEAMRERWRAFVVAHWQTYGPGHCALCRRIGHNGINGVT